ncbi:MAG: helix-turn-helix domain-containing protein [Prevotellaceae bacterium]|jgi:DNA-binding XRE family transcriptional regulator|nr:helix-turn-helix domain-containing protein [Prevotellaceae bacterium]
MRTTINFESNTRMHVVTLDGESIWLETFFPIPVEQQQYVAKLLSHYFDEEFSEDKMSMVYFVLCKTMVNAGFSFSYAGSDREEERKRIGSRIRQLREEKGFEAKRLAVLANIDAANLCKIEQGRYSVGIDVLGKIANALGAQVDLI